MTITRRNHGKGHSYKIDGADAPGVTTMLKQLAAPQLIEWAGKTTAAYAVDHWDELGAMSLSKRLDTLNRARYFDRDAAGGRGTEVHTLAERHMSGEEVTVPDELEGHFRAYESFIADWSPAPVAIEIVVARRTTPRYCGTADIVADLNDGKRWLLDYKTARSGIFPTTAMQLCAYERAEVYLDNDGAEQPVTELGIERVGALHLRADGTYDLVPVVTDDAVWNYFRTLAWEHNHADAMTEWVGAPLRPQVVA